MRRIFVCLQAGLLVVSLSVITGRVSAKQTWTVVAGGGKCEAMALYVEGKRCGENGAVFANAFSPKTIEIGVGDTVRWKFLEFHTVTFLSGTQPPNPFAPEGGVNYFNPKVFFPAGGKTYEGKGYYNSGTPDLSPHAPPLIYSLTFTAPGSFQYVCLLHPGMLGTVVVKEKAMGSPAQAVANGKQEEARILSAGLSAWAKLRPERKGKTVTVSMRGDNRAGYSIYRFTREPLGITRGTTVTWRMADPFEIHTVTFPSGKRPKPGDEILVEPQAQGPPKLRFQPTVERPAGGKVYAGKGYFNSGILFTPPFGPPGAPTSYSLTFTKAGRYEYYCMVHIAEDMKGVIVVR